MKANVISVRNVNDAFHEGLWWLKTSGVAEDSRNGEVLVAPGPVITEYSHPTERILWNEKRDANPVFHLMESLWMLAGMKHAGWLTPFNARMLEYAEGDGNIHGAYGARWRSHFGFDQIMRAINHLRDFPESRRCVVAMWDPRSDLSVHAKDLPCNTHVYFDLRAGKLNMTVCCRSNDMLWGAYGANAVHFSILQEVVAWALGAEVGTYYQMSNNFHLYTDLPQVKEMLAAPGAFEGSPYDGMVTPEPLFQTGEGWQDLIMDCEDVMRRMDTLGTSVFRTKFVNTIAAPMIAHYLRRRGGEVGEQMDVGGDWGLAYMGWLARREEKKHAGK